MNEESYRKTLETGKIHYFSRSRNKLWLKGESSGNIQLLKEMYLDCDADTILIKIEQIGKAACHTGYESCFYNKLNSETKEYEIIGEKIFNPEDVYK